MPDGVLGLVLGRHASAEERPGVSGSHAGGARRHRRGVLRAGLRRAGGLFLRRGLPGDRGGFVSRERGANEIVTGRLPAAAERGDERLGGGDTGDGGAGDPAAVDGPDEAGGCHGWGSGAGRGSDGRSAHGRAVSGGSAGADAEPAGHGNRTGGEAEQSGDGGEGCGGVWTGERRGRRRRGKRAALLPLAGKDQRPEAS